MGGGVEGVGVVRRGSDDGWEKKRRRSFEARSLEEKPGGC